MNDKDFFRKLVKGYLHGKPKEKKILDEYFEFVQDRDSLSMAQQPVGSELLATIHQRMGEKKTNRKFRLFYYYGAAAAVAIIAVTVLLLLRKTEVTPLPANNWAYVTQKGEKKRLVLPDGSKVILNSSSKLILDSAMFKQFRKINLSGEAYFEVVHDAKRPFVVQGEKMSVRVLGTIFNFKSYQGETNEALLLKGSVQVFFPKSKAPAVTLRPSQKFVLGNVAVVPTGQQLVTKGTGFTVTSPKQHFSAVEESKSVAWIHNRLSFENQSFEEVAKLLERWYDVSIIIENPKLLPYRFTGTFNDTGLEDILEALKTSQEFEYRKEGDKIRIY